MLALFAAIQPAAPARIDRHALVSRHNVVRTKLDEHSPLQVGNGESAFSADITGLQTFVSFNTMSNWGWHSSALPQGKRVEDFQGAVWDTHGRPVEYPMAGEGDRSLADWLYHNPHRINLGRVGLEMTHAGGAPVTRDDLRDCRQELDLWTGILRSRFLVDGQPVEVITCCHPKLDAIAARVVSPLIAAGRLSVSIRFPAYNGKEFAEYVGDYGQPGAHRTVLALRGANRADFACDLDATHYSAGLAWAGAASVREVAAHDYCLAAGSGAASLEFTCLFSQKPLPASIPAFAQVQRASAAHWPRFWKSGGAIDLSGSKDPRWRELERRIVLSQYLMAVNEAGALPPQESGLVNNGWNGKFHMEMLWWHAAHYALWDRWPLANPSLGFYKAHIAQARETARREGYEGARWPKCAGPEGRESPHPIHALLIWQQPHPIFFAEMDYRAHPTEATLAKWREVVFATADFMQSYAYRDQSTGQYVLGPPVYVVSENTDPRTTTNPTFELGYWRYGLRIAQLWRERSGMQPEPNWQRVIDGLAPLPEQDGLYVLHEGVKDMWTRFNFEHPALTGVYGLLPGDGVDLSTMRRTFEKVMSVWQFDRTWGWDFPMLAMCAARLGEPKRAVDLLLHPAGGFQFADCGLATGGPYPYFPSNGGLLCAVAMMAAGWDGAPARHAPGFPDDGSWVVRWEGLARAQ